MRVKPDPVISLDGRRSETASPLLAPCPARTTGHLGFERPTTVRCGLAQGHGGQHTYTITWSQED